jgi:hypothetical protein
MSANIIDNTYGTSFKVYMNINDYIYNMIENPEILIEIDG